MRDELDAGAMIADRYTLLEHLPGAPCGARWRVSDRHGGDTRLTWLTPPRALDDEARDRHLSALCRFSHAHAVSVRDAGLHLGAAFVASPQPEGVALRAWIAEHTARRAQVALRDARALVDQVAQCLTAAHRGVGGVAITHGAPLAASVWIERRGETQFVSRLDDLGLLALADVSATAPGARGDGPSIADDVWSLGALLVEALTGEPVAPSADFEAAFERFEAARPDAHPSIWKAARACLARSVADRPEHITRARELFRQVVWAPREIRLAPEAPPPPPPPNTPAPNATPERARIVAVHAAPTPTPAPPTSSPAPSTPSPAPLPTPAPQTPPVSSHASVAAAPITLPVAAPSLAPPPVAPTVNATITRASKPPEAPSPAVTPRPHEAGSMQLGQAGLGRRLRAPTMEADVAARLSTPPESSAEVAPLDAQATIRARRSLFAVEDTTVIGTPSAFEPDDHTHPALNLPDAPGETRDEAPPDETIETTRPPRAHTLPPPTRPPAQALVEPSREPFAARASMAPTFTRERTQTLAVDAEALDATAPPPPTIETETLRAPRLSAPGPAAVEPVVGSSAPEHRASPPPMSFAPAAPRPHTPTLLDETRPSFAPRVSPLPAPPREPTAPPDGRAALWWGVALVLAVLTVLLVAAASTSR